MDSVGNMKVVIRVPIFGNPTYCLMKKNDVDYKTIQKIVKGFFQPAPKPLTFVNPMFCKLNTAWKLVGYLIQETRDDRNKQVEVYCNEDAIRRELPPNEGVYLCNPGEIFRPYLGDLCVITTHKKLSKIIGKAMGKATSTMWEDDIQKCENLEELLED